MKRRDFLSLCGLVAGSCLVSDAKDADLNGAIRKLLKAGKKVRILMWAALPPLTWGGFAVDLGASIEVSLIAFFRPLWNKD